MTTFHVDTQYPTDERRLSSALRVFEIEDFILSTVNSLDENDRALLRAQFILAYERQAYITATTREPIYGYALTLDDMWQYEWCRKNLPDREAFEDAASLINCLDRAHWDNGQATIDEITFALSKALRYVSNGMMK